MKFVKIFKKSILKKICKRLLLKPRRFSQTTENYTSEKLLILLKTTSFIEKLSFTNVRDLPSDFVAC